MSNVIINDVGAVELPLERNYESSSGFVSVRRFKGPQDAIEAKEAELQFMGYATSVRQGPVWELEARISADTRGGGTGQADQPVDSWELFANTEQKDILASDTSVIRTLPNYDVAYLRDLLDGKVDAAEFIKALPDVLTSDALKVFKLIVSGVKSVQYYQPVLRHTRTVSKSYEVGNSLTGWGYVWSSAAIIRSNNIPSSIASQMGTSTAYTRTDGIEVYNGWLKGFPQIHVSAYGKSQIVNEWQYGDWATLLYTTVP